MTTDLYLLSGFLGAGKTTTLEAVLGGGADLSGTLVIVNEAGRLGLDGRIVERAGVPVKELNNGCVCCTLQVELVDLLRRLLSDREPPRRILLEASGLANPLAVVKSVRRFVDRLGLVKTVAVMEAEIWEIRSVMGEAFRQGLAGADLLILNKTEAMDGEAIRSVVEEVGREWPNLLVHPTSYGRIPLELFLAPPAVPAGPLPDCPPEEALGGYHSASLETESPLPRAAWEGFLARWGPRLERIKGQLLLSDGQQYLDWVRGKAGERPALPDVPGTRLVLIGKDVSEAELEADLAALADSSGRRRP